MEIKFSIIQESMSMSHDVMGINDLTAIQKFQNQNHVSISFCLQGHHQIKQI